MPLVRFLIDVEAAERKAGDVVNVPASSAGLLVATGRAVLAEPVVEWGAQTGLPRVDRAAKGYLTK